MTSPYYINLTSVEVGLLKKYVLDCNIRNLGNKLVSVNESCEIIVKDWLLQYSDDLKVVDDIMSRSSTMKRPVDTNE